MDPELSCNNKSHQAHGVLDTGQTTRTVARHYQELETRNKKKSWADLIKKLKSFHQQKTFLRVKSQKNLYYTFIVD